MTSYLITSSGDIRIGNADPFLADNFAFEAVTVHGEVEWLERSGHVRIRLQLGAAASSMSDEQFEDFISHLGGGDVADVDANRAKTASRMGTTQRGLEEYFSIAGHELATLEKRAYNPSRGDIARQLRENRLPATTIEEYRRILHELGTRIGAKA